MQITPTTEARSIDAQSNRYTGQEIHSCSYYCGLSACIKAQRNLLRDQLAEIEPRMKAALNLINAWVDGEGPQPNVIELRDILTGKK